MKRLFISMLLVLTGLITFSQNPLAIPDTVFGSSINLNIQQGTRQFYPGPITQTMGVNGNLLGPTILLNKGQNVTINVKNNLTDTTTIHWHGMHVAPQNDGGPHVTILPGVTWSPAFQVMDHASTHWYHPHLHLKTYDHVQMGIAGFVIVRDSAELALNLPRTYGIDDFPLAIQTKVINANNQIVTAHSPMDTSLMVNGTIKPFLNVPSQVVRLRLLNGSAERVYNIGFNANKTFHQIGGDGGLLTAPVALTRLMIAPGERAEILVDMGADSGKTLQLMNFGTQIPNAYYGASQPGMGAGQVIPGYSSNPLNGKDYTILTLNVGSPTSNPITTIPTSLITHNPWAEPSANITRNLTFMSMGNGPGMINGPFVINNAHFDMDSINYRIPFNNIEIWELRNQTPIAHPFHIHNVPFYILTINGVAPPANMRGRKDVVLVPGGNSIVRFITKFEDFYNDTLPYMYHCHMLTHEDDGMMGQYIVAPPCSLLKTQPLNQSGTIGGTAQFSFQVNDTSGTTYQWQSNIGFGFQDIQNVGQYSGVSTNTLTIAGLSLTNNNQLFRCNVINPTCTVTTNVVALNVNGLGLSSSSKQANVIVYPNPGKTQFTIQVSDEWLGAECFVTDVLGKELLSTQIHSAQQLLGLRSDVSGMVFIHLKKEKLHTTFKLVVE